MLNDFVKKNGALYCGQTASDVIPHIKRRLIENRRAGNLIIYLQNWHSPDDIEFNRFPPHAIGNTFGSEIISELTSKENDIVIKKRCYSGFYGTDLDVILWTKKITVVEIVGVCTSICIMDTVGGLANRDIETVIQTSCVADFDPKMHKMALICMEALYGCTMI